MWAPLVRAWTWSFPGEMKGNHRYVLCYESTLAALFCLDITCQWMQRDWLILAVNKSYQAKTPQTGIQILCCNPSSFWRNRSFHQLFSGRPGMEHGIGQKLPSWRNQTQDPCGFCKVPFGEPLRTIVDERLQAAPHRPASSLCVHVTVGPRWLPLGALGVDLCLARLLHAVQLHLGAVRGVGEAKDTCRREMVSLERWLI